MEVTGVVTTKRSVVNIPMLSPLLRIGFVLLVLCLLIGTIMGLSATTASADPDPDVEAQLCIIMDGSGSIEPEDWAIIIEGLADAIGNPDCTPQDGSLELAIVVFGWFPDDWHAEVALAPIVITSANADCLELK